MISSITGTESGEVFLDRQFGSGHMFFLLYDYSHMMMSLTDRIAYESALLTKADWPLTDRLLTDDWELNGLPMTYQPAYQPVISHLLITDSNLYI